MGAATLGSLLGGLLERLQPAGGMWLFGLSLTGTALGTGLVAENRRDATGPDGHDAAMVAMSCATLGGLAGGLAAYALAHVVLGPEGAHGVRALPAPLSHGSPAPGAGHLAALGMHLMNAAMGAMVGASLTGCPDLKRLLTVKLAWPGFVRPAVKGPP